MIASTVPIGGGLSSSAAFEVATATLAEPIAGESLEPTAKSAALPEGGARICRRPLRHHGPIRSVIGARHDHAMLLDCRSMQFELIPFANHDLTLLIINSQVRHSLAAGNMRSGAPVRRGGANPGSCFASRRDDGRSRTAPRATRSRGAAPAPRLIGEIGRTQTAARDCATSGRRSERRCMPAMRRSAMTTR